MKHFWKKINFLLLMATISIACMSPRAMAQNKPPKKIRKAVLPRVGAITNRENIIFAVEGGCNNHFLAPPQNPIQDASVFIIDSTNAEAWMNLGGQTLRLKLLKTTLRFRAENRIFARHDYSANVGGSKVRITVSFEDCPDYVRNYPAKIVVSRGHASRTIGAIGLAQCGK